jgi:DNA repair protein RadA/Sms
MILAVLDARAGLGLSGHDVYLNVAGGLEIAEPGADLAAAAALVSSFAGEPLMKDRVFFGEISLAGEVRPVPQPELRLKEAAKLGFATAVVPAGTKADGAGLKLVTVKDVGELALLAGARANQRRARMR